MSNEERNPACHNPLLNLVAPACTKLSFVNNIKELIVFWENQKNRNEQERLSGLAFSILCIIDNVSADMNTYKLMINDDNVSGGLHEMLIHR